MATPTWTARLEAATHTCIVRELQACRSACLAGHTDALAVPAAVLRPWLKHDDPWIVATTAQLLVHLDVTPVIVELIVLTRFGCALEHGDGVHPLVGATVLHEAMDVRYWAVRALGNVVRHRDEVMAVLEDVRDDHAEHSTVRALATRLIEDADREPR